MAFGLGSPGSEETRRQLARRSFQPLVSDSLISSIGGLWCSPAARLGLGGVRVSCDKVGAPGTVLRRSCGAGVCVGFNRLHQVGHAAACRGRARSAHERGWDIRSGTICHTRRMGRLLEKACGQFFLVSESLQCFFGGGLAPLVKEVVPEWFPSNVPTRCIGLCVAV